MSGIESSVALVERDAVQPHCSGDVVEGRLVRGNLKVSGKCLGSVQEVSGPGIAFCKCWSRVLEVSGKCLGSVQEVSGQEMSDAFVAWHALQPNCSANVRERRFVKCNLQESGKCMGSVQEVSGSGVATCTCVSRVLVVSWLCLRCV